MTLCPNCIKYSECKEICKPCKKEITGRGKTASPKPKTYPIDYQGIEDISQVLNPFQKIVLNTIKNLSLDAERQLATKLTLQKTIDKTLNDKEKHVIRLFFVEGHKQEDIALYLNVSQPRVNFLLKRAMGKMRNFLEPL